MSPAQPTEITVWVHRRKIVRQGKRIDGYSANCDPYDSCGCTAPTREAVVEYLVSWLKQEQPEASIVVKDAERPAASSLRKGVMRGLRR